MSRDLNFEQLLGCDISHHNYPFNGAFGDFQIHKATEGRTFIDSRFKEWYIARKESPRKSGAYHFMSKPENWRAELEHFETVLREVKFKGIVALDLEDNALTTAIRERGGIESVLNWMAHCTTELNCTPFLYTNTFGTNKLDIRLADYPVWIASYNKKSPEMNGKWKEKQKGYYAVPWFIWQFTNTPFDMDITNMSGAMWDKMSADASK